jgi:glycosyltransferase involved in cell wall biosynthesis
VRILIWHVHGSWTTAFVQGAHDYVVPVLPSRGPDGRGRALTWDWPESVVERTPEQLAGEDVDVVVLQRPHERELVERWLGRRPGRDLRTVYVEHNAPQGRIAEMRHPVADDGDLTVVHVTHFNDLFWDCGSTPTRVIEHGIVDPGYRYTGEIERPAAVINDAPRRGRVTGTDLLDRFGPVDLFGLNAGAIGGIEEVRQGELHDELARRRLYLHPIRWTSLGLSLLEAMHLGMPVVALATTEAPSAVPATAGAVSSDVDALAAAARRFLADRELARETGREARRAALDRHGLERFLADWDELLEAVGP